MKSRWDGAEINPFGCRIGGGDERENASCLKCERIDLDLLVQQSEGAIKNETTKQTGLVSLAPKSCGKSHVLF